jgi:D-glycero-D-manno-heptose 1,7-bisphosphate phosphatase
VTAERAKLVVLDRDGVINEDSDAYIKSVAEWVPIPGSLEAIAALTRAGFEIAVVTNQSGVGRGLYSEQTLAAIHRHMESTIASAGGAIAGIYYCPHRPEDDCECRKPRTALLERLARDRGRSLVGVPFIGDKLSDVAAAQAVGARPILVRTGSGAATERALGSRAVETFDDLRAAARTLVERSR